AVARGGEVVGAAADLERAGQDDAVFALEGQGAGRASVLREANDELRHEMASFRGSRGSLSKRIDFHGTAGPTFLKRASHLGHRIEPTDREKPVPVEAGQDLVTLGAGVPVVASLVVEAEWADETTEVHMSDDRLEFRWIDMRVEP